MHVCALDESLRGGTEVLFQHFCDTSGQHGTCTRACVVLSRGWVCKQAASPLLSTCSAGLTGEKKTGGSLANVGVLGRLLEGKKEGQAS